MMASGPAESAAYITKTGEAAFSKTGGTDLELVVKAKAGDTEAFSELVNRHQQMVYNIAYRFMRNAAQAEDGAQEAFLKAFRLLGGFRGDCHFSTWMYRVTASVCLSELERRKRRAEVALLPSHEGQEKPAGLDLLDVPDMIGHCVGKLPARYKKVITLYYLKEVSFEEVAKLMKIPKGTLKTWMYRARGQLRKILEKEYRFDGLE